MANTLLDLFEKNPQLLEWSDKVTLLSRPVGYGIFWFRQGSCHGICPF